MYKPTTDIEARNVILLKHMKHFLPGKASWIKGGVAGVILGSLLFLGIFSTYPQTDNLYVIYPMYILCQGGLECTFGNTTGESFIFGNPGFVTSIFIHLVIYFSIGALIGLIIGKIKKHSRPQNRF